MTAEEELPAESAEELYENAPCGYLSTRPRGAIARVNDTFLRWTGYERSDLLSRKAFQDLLTLGGKVFYETHFAPLLRMQGYVQEIAFDLTCKDGRLLPVLVNAVQKGDNAGNPLLDRITVFNATERRRYERELLEARREAEQTAVQLQRLNETLAERVASEVAKRMKAEAALRQAQKMEAIGQLTGGVAHDFNNLLTIVVGNIEVLQRRLPQDAARLRRAADQAMEGARRAARLTQQLLAFSRQQPLDPKPIDPNKLVFGMSELLRRTLGETIALETVLGGGLWRTFADPNQLENSIINLAVNARDAMPQGGRLTIETVNVRLDGAYAAERAEPVPSGEYVQIAVSDTGTGMAPDTIGRVFEPFFTTKEAGKGTGLGLSQVYGFVRQSGGHVRIYSELGQGTTIKIYLPRYIGGEQELDPAAHRLAKRDRAGGETILVVEDESELRTYVLEALGELGYKVLAARNGSAALEVLQQAPKIDLLFTDVILPGGMNGRELAEQMARRQPGLKVLFTTGYTRDAVVQNRQLDQNVQLLTKPFTFEHLAAAVRRLLDSQ